MANKENATPVYPPLMADKLTVADVFAANALRGFMARSTIDLGSGSGRKAVASACYNMANDMLKARSEFNERACDNA